MSPHRLLPRRGLVLGMGIIAILVFGFSVVSANPLVQPDKRINQVADFGGDALYCVDSTIQPTIDSSTFYEFRLLSGNGQELWTLSKAIVEEGLGEIKFGNPPVLLGSGHGTFGQINMYGNAAEDGSPYFIFTGFDDHFKPNIITFYGCTPVGNALAAAPSPTPTMEPK